MHYQSYQSFVDYKMLNKFCRLQNAEPFLKNSEVRLLNENEFERVRLLYDNVSITQTLEKL